MEAIASAAETTHFIFIAPSVNLGYERQETRSGKSLVSLFGYRRPPIRFVVKEKASQFIPEQNVKELFQRRRELLECSARMPG